MMENYEKVTAITPKDKYQYQYYDLTRSVIYLMSL